MKKLICLLLALFTVASLAACGGAGSTAESGNDVIVSAGTLDLTLPEYKLIYDVSDSNAIILMTDLQGKINEKTINLGELKF